MAAAEKFMFGRDFAEETGPAAAPAAEPAPEPEPEPEPEPSYSPAELEAAKSEARDAAYRDGLAEGRRQAEAEADQALTQATDRLGQALGELARDQVEQIERRDREALQTAVQLLRRLFPALTRRHGQAEIEAVLQQALERLRDEPRVVVRVADSRLDALRERVDPLAQRVGFEGRIVLLADAEIADGDVRVEWADGGAERDSDRLWREVERAVERALAPRGDAGDRTAERGGGAGAQAPDAPEPSPADAPAEARHSA